MNWQQSRWNKVDLKTWDEPVGDTGIAINMKQYRCTYQDCNYVYDPKVGEPGIGIEAGTEFEDLPYDWVCPDCGATKDYFEEIED